MRIEKYVTILNPALGNLPSFRAVKVRPLYFVVSMGGIVFKRLDHARRGLFDEKRGPPTKLTDC